LDIGNFSKRTIFTGAGWTRNWGGRLATELWQDLIGHRAIQNNSRLRELLLGEPSFETALGLVRAAPFTSSDRQTFEGALLDAFIAMDREAANCRPIPATPRYSRAGCLSTRSRQWSISTN
jgi:hypothetical protein